MAQNITIQGASYSAVPAVTLPKTGGGTASFFDVSDTTAAAEDVASGTYFYTANGVRTEGTNSGGGGGGTITQDAQGYLHLSKDGGGGGGGSDLVKIGDVTITATPSLYLIGGIWKDGSTMTTMPEATYTSKTLELYAPTGQSSVEVMIMTSYYQYAGMSYWNTASGSVSLRTYSMTISGNCTLAYYN